MSGLPDHSPQTLPSVRRSVTAADTPADRREESSLRSAQTATAPPTVPRSQMRLPCDLGKHANVFYSLLDEADGFGLCQSLIHEAEEVCSSASVCALLDR